MFSKSYDQAINWVGDNAPTLDMPTQFLAWAESIAELLAYVYSVDYDDVTLHIVDAAKEAQGIEDSEED